MMFADLEVPFDNVDRRILWRILRDRGINEKLVKIIKKIYEETEVMIKNKQKFTEKFWTRKGVRQGCVMSPLLFNIYMAELEEYFENRNVGGIEIGKVRVWNLAYADDIVIVGKNREALLDMMSTFKRFLGNRKLTLCAEKTKIMVFNRGRKESKETWKWGKERIEEVQEFKYLGFTFNRKGSYGDHIKELYRKGRIAARRVWGLGERVCRDDFGRRWTLFRYLVQSAMSYGVEIWGWEEKETLEKVMMDYVRWIFRLDFCTPRYIITRELRMDRLRVGWGLRARRYEEKILEESEASILKNCWREKEKHKWRDIYSKEREKYYNRNGWGIDVLENLRREGYNMEEELIGRERDIQRQWEDGRIATAKYNKRYREIGVRGEGPKYLRKESIEKGNMGEGIRALIKLRCGNLEEVNKYWLEEGSKRCIFCGEGTDCMEHYIEKCKRNKRMARKYREG